MKDPWGQPVATPDTGVNPWAEEAATPGETSARPRRALWRPNTAAVVITACGHIELEWEIIRILGGKFVKQVYCELCGEWMTYKRAKAIDIIKIRAVNNQELF